MKLDVGGKLIINSMIFVAVIGLVVGLMLEQQLRSSLESRIEDELARHAKVARDVLDLAQPAAAAATLDPVADQLGSSADARVTIIAADGTVLGDSALPLSGVGAMESHADRPEIRAALASGEGRSERFSTTLGTPMTYVAVPFGSAGSVVRVGMTNDEIGVAIGQLRWTLIAAGLIALAAAAVLAAVASQVLSGSLRSLLATAQATVVNKGSGVEPEEPEPDDDQGEARSFKQLSDKLERALATIGRERDRFETVLETMDQAVLALDRNRMLTMVNRRARQMLELPEPIIGRSLLDYVRVPELRALVAAAEQGDNAQAEFAYGTMPALRLAAQATAHSGGGCVVVIHDVTEIRRLETIRKDFVANVSHELRTPVAVIRANAETLLAGALDNPERATTFIEALHRHADRLGRLVADLLDISRIEAGRYTLDVDDVELSFQVDRTIDSLATEAQARSLKVVRGFDGPCSVRADDKALEQILVNLISNAIKYSDGGERVEVDVGESEGQIRIEVRDDGPGIDPKHHLRVFERFYRVDSGRARDHGGTGLGLAIVKHLVEAMGGRVGVDARRPRGSVFWFTLPIAVAADDQLPLALGPAVGRDEPADDNAAQ